MLHPITLITVVLTMNDPNLSEIQTMVYSINEDSTVIVAEFGKSYLLEGNFIARFSDF